MVQRRKGPPPPKRPVKKAKVKKMSEEKPWEPPIVDDGDAMKTPEPEYRPETDEGVDQPDLGAECKVCGHIRLNHGPNPGHEFQ